MWCHSVRWTYFSKMIHSGFLFCLFVLKLRLESFESDLSGEHFVVFWVGAMIFALRGPESLLCPLQSVFLYPHEKCNNILPFKNKNKQTLICFSQYQQNPTMYKCQLQHPHSQSGCFIPPDQLSPSTDLIRAVILLRLVGWSVCACSLQCWHTGVGVFVLCGELLAASFSGAGLHCVETLQLLPSSTPSSSSSFLPPQPPCFLLHLHVKWSSQTCLTLLRNRADVDAALVCFSALIFNCVCVCVFFLFLSLKNKKIRKKIAFTVLRRSTSCPSSRLVADFCWCRDVWECQGLARCPLMHLSPNCSATSPPAVCSYAVCSAHHRAAAKATLGLCRIAVPLFSLFYLFI